MADLIGQRCPNVKFKADDCSEGHKNERYAHFREPASRGICFHDPTLFLLPPDVLIERIYDIIDPDDGDEKAGRLSISTYSRVPCSVHAGSALVAKWGDCLLKE